MINKTLIKNLKNEVESKDNARAGIVGQALRLGREAKHIVFQLQRGNIKQGEATMATIGKRLHACILTAAKAGLRQEGSLSAAIEEYLEAWYLSFILQDKPVPSALPLPATAVEQLGALADVTGELVRAATLEATAGRFHRIRSYRDTNEELFAILLQMNLHGCLRQKRDDARRNLKRLEEILYDVSLRITKGAD